MTRALKRPESATLHRLYVDDRDTIARIALRFGVANQTVHNWLIAAKIPRRASTVGSRTDITDDKIRQLYVTEGRTAAEIARCIGCGVSTIYHRLERLGIDRRPPGGRRKLQLSDDELRRLYAEEGLSLEAIAQRHQVTAQAVRDWLIAAGIPRRPPGSMARVVDDAVLSEEYRKGATGDELATRYGCSPATVYRRLEAAGVPRRQRPPVLDRAALVAALDADLPAPAIAAKAGVSISAVCRALNREGLRTRSQAAKRAAPVRYADYVARAERAGTTDAAFAWLRSPTESAPATPTSTNPAPSSLERTGSPSSVRSLPGPPATESQG